MRTLSRLALPIAAFLLLTLAACSGGRGAASGDDPGEGTEEPDLSRYEDFNPAPYREDAPATREEIDHDVPERLLAGRADAGVEQTVQGYRVQILSSKNKDAAENAAVEAQQWWNSQSGEAPADLFAADGFSVYTIYRQPYYRVRVGNFTSRAEAERALEFLRQRYNDAFIARGEVTVTR